MEWWPFSKTYKIRCPDGTERIVHKDANNAFPLSIVGTSGALSAEGNISTSTTAKLKGQFAKKVDGLLISLDESNSSLMMKFRAAYICFQANPCNPNGIFDRQIEEINQEHSRLLNAKAKIGLLVQIAEIHPTNPEKMLPLYQEIVQLLGGSAIPPAVSEAIAEARDVAKDWIEGEFIG